ncbi:hypothetical protein PR001_g20945 [Phytophthora rubi]|uniref:Uncharacterized protein n=1 Tax=Phytophthora rubi TaxID=129364 RepID=A0A6A3JCS4_9STRA|nr:hypothetical protein PR001_g20945 [Phytophthora rubi]
MTVVASLVSEHACELIHGQYTYALGPASYTVDEGCPDVYFLKSVSTEDDALDEVNAEYSVTKRDWNCFGLFMSTRFLPCRHLRKALGDDTVIPTQLLNGRWLFSSKSAWVSSMNKYQHQATIRAGNPSSESGNHSGETGNHSSEAGNHSGETDELSANTDMSSQMMGVRSGSVE